LNGLINSIASLDAQVESLKASQANLRQKIELFQARKEELKALYDSSRAQLKVKEAASGVSKDLADAAHAIQRAETRIQTMQSRVDAIDDLIATGALEDVLSPDGDDIDRELARLTLTATIESELERLKAEAAEGQPVESQAEVVA
jgi:phage shock protein A